MRFRVPVWLVLVAAAIAVFPASSAAQPGPIRSTTIESLADQGTDTIAFEAIVRSVTPRDGQLELDLGSQSWPVTAVTPDTPVAASLVDTKVRLRGTRVVQRTPQGTVSAVRVTVPEIAETDIVERPIAAPFDLPVLSLAKIREVTLQHAVGHRVRARATVLMKSPTLLGDGRVLHLQDDTAGVVVAISDDTGIAVGDQVDVAAFPAQFYGMPSLTNGVVRREGAGVLPVPPTVTVDDLVAGRRQGMLVRLRGTFTDTARAATYTTVSMASGPLLVTAYLYDWPPHGALPPVERGSTVDMTGTTAVIYGADGKPQSIVMNLRDPEAIAVIRSPSWWTPTRIVLSALGALALVGAVLAWIWMLNAQVRAQTRALAEQFDKTAALQRRWTDLIATATDVILTWDLEGRILSVNRTGEALIGLGEDGLRRLTLADIVASQSAEAARALIAGSGTPAGQTSVIEVVGSDGLPVPLEMSVQPMTENGVQIGYQAIGRNVAAHKAVETALRAARDAAEQANRAKSEFLANMSHEIRTPMNGIMGMTELALATDLTAAQREYLETIKVSADSLLGLLNGILDFSKIESRKLELESVPFGLRDLIADTLKPLAFKADEKRLELLCDIAPDTPDGLIGDPLRLRQIITNLISNAIKFTEHGHVLLTVREEAEAKGSTRLHLSVADTGLGIPADKHATIFESFSQADGSTTRRFGGSGLGLAISATLVRLMGGRIWVESEPGRGSTFHCTAAFDTAAVVEPAKAEPMLASLPVLVVDDNPINRRIFSEQLARWGMKVTMADGGWAGIEALEQAARRGEPYLLVLLDANMPEVDGFAVATHIRSRPELTRATIMMLTSAGEYGDADRCRALNISAYLTKPIAPKHLFEAICRVVGGRGAGAVSPAPAARSTAVTPVLVRRKVLLAEDNIVNQRVAIGLLTKRGHEVILAENGREAIDALERDTFDVVLMDVQMPEMDGLEATAEIRRRETETHRHVRIVAMTAHAMNGDRDRCLSAGMDGYLSKPVNPEMLYAVVEEEALRPGPPVTVKPAGEVTVDERALQARLGGDTRLFNEVINAFLGDCPAKLAEIRRAIEQRDTDAVRARAHALKGAAGNLSAPSLFAAAAALERVAAEQRLDALDAAWRQMSAEAANVMDALRRCESSDASI